ncbi:3-isopropylmalate dehydratase small subunit [candidate division KSB1 bacterium]|nr:3-isopropylmalate dehydratase small subunit [candidate division KSB1 bacterium]
MEPFTVLQSTCVVLPVDNIDTDQIIPARYLKGTDKQGLGQHLFQDWRYDEKGRPKADFILNQPQARYAKILVAGDNFGCGSSREHAPWALVDFGFRAVVSSGFADIFRNNALKNGLLPVQIPQQELKNLYALPGGGILTIHLTEQSLILPDGHSLPFAIESFYKTCLLQGLDTLGYLFKYEKEIAAYEHAKPARVNTRM